MSNSQQKAKAPRCHTIYQIRYLQEDTPSGIVQEWFTTHNKATRRLRQLKLLDSERVYIVEVPKTRVGLCEFLNASCAVG